MNYFRNTGQPDRDWWSELWPDPHDVLRELGVESGMTVADVCCGDGYFALAAAKIVEPGTLYAVDLDSTLLDTLAAAAAAENAETIETVRGDAREVAALLPERVEFVLVMNTFHGVDDRRAFVEELHRAMRPGGRLAIVNWHDRPRAETTVGDTPRGPPTDRRLSPEATRTAVENASFDVLAELELEPYHYGLVFQRRNDG